MKKQGENRDQWHDRMNFNAIIDEVISLMEMQ
jgi:hypothetical protein